MVNRKQINLFMSNHLFVLLGILSTVCAFYIPLTFNLVFWKPFKEFTFLASNKCISLRSKYFCFRWFYGVFIQPQKPLRPEAVAAIKNGYFLLLIELLRVFIFPVIRISFDMIFILFLFIFKFWQWKQNIFQYLKASIL